MSDHNNPYEIWLARRRDTSVSDDFADRVMDRIAADQCVPAKPVKNVSGLMASRRLRIMISAVAVLVGVSRFVYLAVAAQLIVL
jgi:hypothetical protein